MTNFSAHNRDLTPRAKGDMSVVTLCGKPCQGHAPLLWCQVRQPSGRLCVLSGKQAAWLVHLANDARCSVLHGRDYGNPIGTTRSVDRYCSGYQSHPQSCDGLRGRLYRTVYSGSLIEGIRSTERADDESSRHNPAKMCARWSFYRKNASCNPPSTEMICPVVCFKRSVSSRKIASA